MPIKATNSAIEKHCIMTDKDISSDALGSQKNLMVHYNTAITESSCPKMRQLLESKYAECAQDQFDIFQYMSQKGFYPTEDAPSQKVSQAKTKYQTNKP